MLSVSGCGVLPRAAPRFDERYSGKTQEARDRGGHARRRGVAGWEWSNAVASAAANAEEARNAKNRRSRRCCRAGVEDVAFPYSLGADRCRIGIARVPG